MASNDKSRLNVLFPQDAKASEFFYNLNPLKTNSVTNTQFDLGQLIEDRDETRIIVHPDFPALVEDFMSHKLRHGSSLEKALYGTPGWSWQEQTARLIAKRPLMFMNGNDSTVLRNGASIGGQAAEWDRVGTNDDAGNKYLHFDEHLSYDEIMLGSLIGVSGPSYFINEGSRYNEGEPGKVGSFEPRGIIVGLVGARFERRDRMDSALILPAAKNPRQHPELTELFQRFFKATKNQNVMFDVGMYQGRMRITAETLLLEARERAHAAGKKAYLYVVGLGLGVWMKDQKAQTAAFVGEFAKALAALGSKMCNIGTIEFGYVGTSNVPSATLDALNEAAGVCGIDIIFSKRDPAEKLKGSKADQLLVLSYAWDGNAFPGNEYWIGSLSASGDPAAACMSTISELHNPALNPGLLQRTHVLKK